MPKGRLKKPIVRACEQCGNDFDAYYPAQYYCDDCRKHRDGDPNQFKGDRCEVCGWDDPADLRAHHIKAKSKGGEMVAENMATLCIYCHRAVHLVRRKQTIKLTKKGLKRFKELAEECNARITPRLAFKRHR